MEFISGFDILLGVLAKHDVAFVLAGGDDHDFVHSTLVPEIRREARHGSVTYLGALGLGEVRSCVQHADIYLFPSLWDSCPSAVLEAMSAGKAIVTSDAGGLPELITHRENGLMAPSDHPAGFVDALSELIDTPSLRDSLGAAARRTVEARFTDVIVARDSVEIYRSLQA